MEIQKSCSIFCQIIMSDGIEIITSANDEIFLKTIIQSGDLITHVSEKALEYPDICETHLKSVNDKISDLKEFRKYLVYFIKVFQLSVLVISFFLCWQSIVKEYTRMLIIALIFSILSLMINNMLRWFIMYYIKRAVKF